MDGVATSTGLLPAVLSGFGGSVVAARLLRRSGLKHSALLALIPAALTAYFASLVPAVADGRVLEARFDWLEQAGLQLSLRLDGLSLLFALLITGIGTLVTVYSGPYLARAAHPERFFVFLLAFMASMLGLVLSSNLLAIYLFWELTSLCSYFLIAFHHQREGARSAALQALLVTAAGGLVLLAGVVMLGSLAGSMEWNVLLERRELIRSDPRYPATVLLVAIACFTKSAQFPFHFWLPRAMQAPTPASAYLHAATMVKAGVFLLLRLAPVLGGTELWTVTLATIGGLTAVHGAAVAVWQTHLKRLLAWATVSALGVLVLLVGVGTEAAIRAALLYLLAHALYKGALFLVAGNLGRQAGTLEVRRIRGMARAMPLTAVAAVLASSSLAGVPPLLGFAAKESLYTSMSGRWGLVPAVIASTLLVVVALVMVVRPFFRAAAPSPRPPHEAPWGMRLPVLLLAGAGLLAAFAGGTIDALIEPAVKAVMPGATPAHFALWHGMGPELALSALSLVAGLGIYLVRPRLRFVASRIGRGEPFSLSVAWDRGLEAFLAVSRRFVDRMQSGYLRRYVLVYALVTVSGIALVYASAHVPAAPPSTSILAHEAMTALAIVVATIATTLAASRMAAITAACVAGFGMVLLFVFFGAPDLAMTQFVVESLTVVIFVLAFRRLPTFAALSTKGIRLRDAAIAISLGVVMTLLVRSASPLQLEPQLSDWFVENSVREGHGRNAVNVILTDFRALDTLGEITVLTIATFGIVALVRIGRLRRSGGAGR